jgi:transcription initiation factor TFIIA small subunit
MSCIAGAGTAHSADAVLLFTNHLPSLGLSLTDTLDDLINEGRIEPQLAMKILSTFDRVITEVLADKVRARLTFKVASSVYNLHDRSRTLGIERLF